MLRQATRRADSVCVCVRGGGGGSACAVLCGLYGVCVSVCVRVFVSSWESSGTVSGCGVGMILEDCDNPTYNNYNVVIRSLRLSVFFLGSSTLFLAMPAHLSLVSNKRNLNIYICCPPRNL
jgi:hypothetical protein